jgi:hypothetical protein
VVIAAVGAVCSPIFSAVVVVICVTAKAVAEAVLLEVKATFVEV